MGKYFVIRDADFKKYNLRKYGSKWKLIIAYCQQEKSGEWYAVNINRTSEDYHDIILFVRMAKELNGRHSEELLKLWSNSS